MIKDVHAHLRISGIDIIQKYGDKDRLNDYIPRRLVRHIVEFLLDNGMMYITKDHNPAIDEYTYKGTIYVNTEDDFIKQQRGIAYEPYSEEAVALEQSGYERGVRMALDRLAHEGCNMQREKLKRDQHAGDVLAEVAQTMYLELYDSE